MLQIETSQAIQRLTALAAELLEGSFACALRRAGSELAVEALHGSGASDALLDAVIAACRTLPHTDEVRVEELAGECPATPVSYTHLTLPTTERV